MPQRLAQSTVIDISQCEREPVHAPGAVQPFGGLAVFASGTPGALIASHASANLATFFRSPVEAILGRPMSAWAPSDLVDRVAAAAEALQDDGAIALGETVGPDGGRMVGTLVRRTGLLMLEVERASEGRRWDEPAPLWAATGSSHWDLARAGAERIRTASGYDRVMIYRFHADWSGEVIAEARNPTMTPFLGLRYPASDIPAQARALYLSNRLRVLGDVNAAPIPLLAAPGAAPASSLDIGTVQVRAMSPVHLQYLRNMGVAATMVASLIVDGRLWGLIACHHGTPHVPAMHVRTATLEIAATVSRRIAEMERRDADETSERVAFRIAQITDALRNAPDPAAALLFGYGPLATALGADGVALVCGDVVVSTGLAATATWCRAAAQDVVARPERIFATDGAGGDQLPIGPPGHRVCGVRAAALWNDPPVVAIAFSGELVETVRWGGDPGKPVDRDQGGDRLTPRRSFEEWRQTVVGRSRPQTTAEAEALSRLPGLLGSAAAARRIHDAASDLASQAAAGGMLDEAFLDAAAEGLGLIVGHGSTGRIEIIRMNRLLRDFMPHVVDREDDERARTTLLRSLGVDPIVLAGETVPVAAEVEAISMSAGPRILRVSFRRLLEVDTIRTRERLVAISCLDITEFRRFEEALQVATTRALEGDRVKSSFLANMSHELRTPLNAIIGFSEMISHEIFGPVGNDRYAEYANDINSAGEHLLSLINDVLDVSRLSARGRDLDLELMDLVTELRTSADLLTQQATARKQTFDVDLPDLALPVRADRRAIRQVALNLLSNAFKFTPPGGRVRLTTRLTPATVGFAVSDTGIGIPPAQHEAVFKPFRQVSNVLFSDQGGTGLGLPISRALMELHGGGITLESSPGAGTTVCAWLPRHAAEDPAR
jgi:light-regulated signal transduction histidine kinase (bacteriophytochrome)